MPSVNQNRSEAAFLPLSSGKNYYVKNKEGKVKVSGYEDGDNSFVITDLHIDDNFEVREPREHLGDSKNETWFPNVYKEYEKTLMPKNHKMKEDLMEEFFKSKKEDREVDLGNLIDLEENYESGKSLMKELQELKQEVLKSKEAALDESRIDNFDESRFAGSFFETPLNKKTLGILKGNRFESTNRYGNSGNNVLDDRDKIDLYLGDKVAPNNYDILGHSAGKLGKLSETGKFTETSTTEHPKPAQRSRRRNDPLIFKPGNIGGETMIPKIPISEISTRKNLGGRIPVKEIAPFETSIATNKTTTGPNESRNLTIPIQGDSTIGQVEKFDVPVPLGTDDWLSYCLRVIEELNYFILFVGAEYEQLSESSIVRRVVYYIRRHNLQPRRIGKDGGTLQLLGSTVATMDDLIQRIFENFVDRNSLLKIIESRLFDPDNDEIDRFIERLTLELRFIFSTDDKDIIFKYILMAFRADHQLTKFFEQRFMFKVEENINMNHVKKSLTNFLENRNITNKTQKKVKINNITSTDARKASQIENLKNDFKTEIYNFVMELNREKEKMSEPMENFSTIHQRAVEGRNESNSKIQEIKNLIQSNQAAGNWTNRNVRQDETKSSQKYGEKPSYVESRKKKSLQIAVVRNNLQFFKNLIEIFPPQQMVYQNLKDRICELCYAPHPVNFHQGFLRFKRWYPEGYSKDRSDEADMNEFAKNLPKLITEIESKQKN